jgi:hypothetical protein
MLLSVSVVWGAGSVLPVSAAELARQRLKAQQEAFEGMSLEAVLKTVKKDKTLPSTSRLTSATVSVAAR